MNNQKSEKVLFADRLVWTHAPGVLQANGSIASEPMMDAKHVADAVCQIASFPLETNILNMTIMASNMPYVGRG